MAIVERVRRGGERMYHQTKNLGFHYKSDCCLSTLDFTSVAESLDESGLFISDLSEIGRTAQ